MASIRTQLKKQELHTPMNRPISVARNNPPHTHTRGSLCESVQNLHTPHPPFHNQTPSPISRQDYLPSSRTISHLFLRVAVRQVAKFHCRTCVCCSPTSEVLAGRQTGTNLVYAHSPLHHIWPFQTRDKISEPRTLIPEHDNFCLKLSRYWNMEYGISQSQLIL